MKDAQFSFMEGETLPLHYKGRADTNHLILLKLKLNYDWTLIEMYTYISFLDQSLTIFYTDCGGQPELHEVLPALVAGPTLFLLAFSLHESLDMQYLSCEVRNYESSSTSEVMQSWLLKTLFDQ